MIPVTSAFCTIQDYSAGVAFVDFELVRNGSEGYGKVYTDMYGDWVGSPRMLPYRWL